MATLDSFWMAGAVLALAIAAGAIPAGRAPSAQAAALSIPAGKPVDVEWRPAGWSGAWAKDISGDCPVEKLGEGHWRITNNYKAWPHSLIKMMNVDIRQGPVEVDLKTVPGGCNLCVMSLSDADAHFNTQRFADNGTVHVRLDFNAGRYYATIGGARAELQNFNSPRDAFRPALAVKAGVTIEVLAVRQEAMKPAAVEWGSPGGAAGKWAMDISPDCLIERIGDSHCRITNNYKGWGHSLVEMMNLDIRQGAVELDLRVSRPGCNLAAYSVSGADAHFSAMKLEADKTLRLRLERDAGKYHVRYGGIRTDLAGFNSPLDAFRPTLSLPSGAVVDVFSVRQVHQPEATRSVTVEWRPVGWNGKWAQDISFDCPVQTLDDGHVRIADNYTGGGAALVEMKNVDLRLGPVETDLEVSKEGCCLVALSLKGGDSHFNTPKLPPGKPLRVRMEISRGKYYATINGDRVDMEAINGPKDAFLPAISLLSSAAAEITEVRQVLRPEASKIVRVDWRPVGWSKDSPTDVSRDCPVQKLTDGHWRITNKYEPAGNTVLAMNNLDIAQGAVEFELRVSDDGSNFILFQDGNADTRVSTPIFASKKEVCVRLQRLEGKCYATIDGVSHELPGSANLQGPLRPALSLPAGAVAEIISVRQPQP